MRHVIDNKLILTDHGIAAAGSESTELNMSTIPLRLLTFFVMNSNKLITRDEIYFHVWEKYNLTPSGTALATQMSYIRKILSAYGLSGDSLVTKPKKGFIFNAVVTSEELHLAAITSADESDTTTLTDSQPSMYYSLVQYIFLFIIIANTFYFVTRQNNPIVWTPLDTIKNCQVFIMAPDMSQSVSLYFQKKARDFINKTDLHCSTGDMVVTYIQHPDISGHNNTYETKQFYSYCKKMKEVYLCNNTYYSAGKVE